MPPQDSNKGIKKRDPKVDFKTLDARIKPLPGVEIRPDVEIQPDTSNWLTRLESAEFLKVSVTTIANYERDGKLHERHAYREDSRGNQNLVKVYDPKELAALRRFVSSQQSKQEHIENPGELAARCYELFEQSLSLNEIVIRVRKTPDQIRELREKWLDGGGAEMTINPVIKKALENVVGPFKDVTELVELVEGLARKVHAEPT